MRWLRRRRGRGSRFVMGRQCTGVVEEQKRMLLLRLKMGRESRRILLLVLKGFIRGFDHTSRRMARGRFSGLMGVMGTVMAGQLDQKTVNSFELPCMLFGTSGAFAIMPSSFSGDENGYFSTTETKDRGREGWPELDRNKSELEEMLKSRFLTPDSKWPKMVKAICGKAPKETLTSWPFFSVPHIDEWSSEKKRVLVIGDAAHAIPPTVSAPL
jgi:2-polyprenyl-6-methoxyphenol hydroxylase-like FAD-dependent oxidoreductase